ncbi:MAG: hypothetical protein WAO08_13735 [Hyphomicrobiaceae bacterium]
MGRPAGGKSDYLGVNAGKCKPTTMMLDELNKLHPDVVKRIANSPTMSVVAKAMAARDAEFAAQRGLPERYNVQNLREVMSRRLERQAGWRFALANKLAALPGQGWRRGVTSS